MLIRTASDIPYSEITPKSVYVNRRRFLKSGLLFCVAAGTGRGLHDMISPRTRALAGTKLASTVKSPFSTSETQTPYNDVMHYNNFYEFGSNKADPSEKAKDFKTSPWTISVEGLVNRPQRLDMDSIMRLAHLEERIFRHRCVEAWSIVVPWIGYSLSVLLQKAEPTPKARFVAFESYTIPSRCHRHDLPESHFPMSRDCVWTKP